MLMAMKETRTEIQLHGTMSLHLGFLPRIYIQSGSHTPATWATIVPA